MTEEDLENVPDDEPATALLMFCECVAIHFLPTETGQREGMAWKGSLQSMMRKRIDAFAESLAASYAKAEGGE